MPGSTRAAWLPEESALQINTGICLSHCPADIPHTQQAHLLPKYKKHDFFFFSSRIPTCGNRGLSVILLCIQSLCPRQRQVHFRFMWAAHLARGALATTHGRKQLEMPAAAGGMPALGSGTACPTCPEGCTRATAMAEALWTAE